MTMTGCTSYRELTAQQHDNFKSVFEKFLPEIKPVRLVEIGTAGGGTTLAINDIMKTLGYSYEFRSYDIYEHPWYHRLPEEGIDLRIENLFDQPYRSFNPDAPDRVQELINFIQSPGTTLVMCDGGHKIAEFELFSDIIKPGDFIMAHDFSWTWEIFLNEIKEKIWDWCEISGENVAEAIARNRLEPYMKDEFQAVAWGCMRKPNE
jgi:cephalosporin hydroxylase